MHVLITNDDGYKAPGLTALVEAFKAQHHTVTIVSTRDDRSGSGMALSLRKPVNVEKLDHGFYVVDGTPADCTYIGLYHLSEQPVDLVVSGINNGPNLADDVLYSGTFAAAMEARRMALPALAISITKRDVKHYETAAFVAVTLANALPHLSFRTLLAVLNVNLPDIPVSELRGFKATLLGEREAPVAPILESESGNETIFLAGPAGEFRRIKRSKMQDFEAVEQGFASVTPLSSTFDDNAHVVDVQNWLDSLS